MSWSCLPELGIDDPDRNIALQFDAVIEDADRPGGEVGAARRGSSCRSGIGEANVPGLGVGIILGARAGDEMVGVYATPDVAAVAQDQAVGDRPVLHLPGDPVGVLRVPRPVLANETAVTRLERPMPDVAAAQGVGLAVISDPLSVGPAPLASGR